MRPPALLEIDESNKDLTEWLGAFLEEIPDITGISVSNDFLAMATMRGGCELGLSEPGDPSIVGFDGIYFGLMVAPSLATIETDPKMLGAVVNDTVLSLIDGTSPPEMPDQDHTFRFRAGGSLAPLVAESKDGEKVAAFPPSIDPTKRPLNPNRRNRRET